MKTLPFPRQSKTLLACSFALCTLLITLAACSQGGQDSPSPNSSKATISAADYRSMRVSFTALEGNWWLTTYQNAPLPQHQQNIAWLRLEKQSDDVLRMGGVAFPNHYGGTFRLDEEKGLVVLTDPIVQTLIGGSEEQMKAEGQLLDALSKAKTFELTGSGQLKIYTGEKGNPATEVLVFTKN